MNPVRFLENRSSGKMGFSLAKASAQLGAEVTIIYSLVKETIEKKGVRKIPVTSAEEMLNKSLKYFRKCDVLIMAAAVSDYKAVLQF
ncbi:phosphopantothenoylcysteine decarboxylase [Bacteroidetes bacterium endosymbiont of Geopemphigus sp.]|uniref:phosphopantothenoylcysteine decarboxylase domain-containing protein n=1 Tax=Bacteroidetes bacterium endosymbiont of Geopemphigus sp. TaxID=2047937 RepID=UPI002243D26B|nr:phosphopantothenoylcysteine decarboxylase [Bacteroidetes bacterium endosymbiont of Geopemphigus sp.]